MRITNGMMVSTLNRNLSRNMTEMDKMQNQLATGKRISKPSDDPVGIAYALRLRNTLVENEQYSKNVDEGMGLLDSTDSALGETGSVLQRIRELAVAAANSTNDSGSLEAIRDEIHELRGHLSSVANTDYAGKYIFSGTKTNTPAFSGNPELWQGNTTQINYEVGVGVKIPVNVTGDQVFGDNVSNVFMDLDTLENALVVGNGSNISSMIGKIDKWMDKVNSSRSEVGARVNRLEFTKSRLESNNVNFTDLLSKTEDADMAQLISQYKVQESVYRASLAAGARVVQPTLIDFMR